MRKGLLSVERFTCDFEASYLHVRSNFSRGHFLGMHVSPHSGKYFYAIANVSPSFNTEHIPSVLSLSRGTSCCLRDRARSLLIRQRLYRQREKLKHGERKRTHLFSLGEPSLQTVAINKHPVRASSARSTTGQSLHTQLPWAAAKAWGKPGWAAAGKPAPAAPRSPLVSSEALGRHPGPRGGRRDGRRRLRPAALEKAGAKRPQGERTRRAAARAKGHAGAALSPTIGGGGTGFTSPSEGTIL